MLGSAFLVWVGGLGGQDSSAGDAGAENPFAALEVLGRACSYDYAEEEIAFFFEEEPDLDERRLIDAIAGWFEIADRGEELAYDELLAFFETSLQRVREDGELRWATESRRRHVELDGAGGLLQIDTGRRVPEVWLISSDLALNFDARHGRLLAVDRPVSVRLYDIDTVLGPLFASPPRIEEMSQRAWEITDVQRDGAARRVLVATERDPAQSPDEPAGRVWRIELESPAGLPAIALRRIGDLAMTLAVYRHGPASDGERWLAEVLYLTWFEGSEVSVARRRLTNVTFDVQPSDFRIVVPDGTVLQDSRAGAERSYWGAYHAEWPDAVKAAVEIEKPPPNHVNR